MSSRTLTRDNATSPMVPRKAEGLCTLLKSPTHRVPLIRDIALSASLVALAALICGIGAVPTVMYGHDLFPALDAGWRVLCGQRPHVEFFTGLGPIAPVLVGVGLRLAGSSASGIGYASAIAGLLLSLWGYGLACRRLPFALAAAVSVFIFFLTATPVPIGEASHFAFSHAMYYTRWAFGLLAILLLECLTPDESGVSGGISTGIACAALLYLKLNMFFIGLGILGPSLVLRSRRDRLIGLTLGAALGSVPPLAGMGFDVHAIWHDYRIIVEAKSHSVALASMLGIAESYLGTLVVVISIALLAVLTDKRSNGLARCYPLITGVSVFFAGVLALATNWQRSGMPLNAVFAILVAQRLHEHVVSLREFTLKRHLFMIAAIVSSLMFVWPLLGDVASVAVASRLKFVEPRQPIKRFAATSLESYAVFGGPQADKRPVDGVYLVNKVNDGLELLTQYSTPRESVATLDLFNPFSFALRRTPNLGGADFLAYGFNFNDRAKPVAQQVIGTADLVMVPKTPNLERDDFAGVMRNYGPYLEDNFEPVAESKAWVLWKKKANRRTANGQGS